MAGGGVEVGRACGATDESGYTALEQPIRLRDLNAAILRGCGLDVGKFNDNGVGFDTACKVAKELFA